MISNFHSIKTSEEFFGVVGLSQSLDGKPVME